MARAAIATRGVMLALVDNVMLGDGRVELALKASALRTSRLQGPEEAGQHALKLIPVNREVALRRRGLRVPVSS